MNEWTVSAKNAAIVAKGNNDVVILEHRGQGISWLVENRLYILENAPNGLSVWAGYVKRMGGHSYGFEMYEDSGSFRKLKPEEFDRLSKELPVIEPWLEEEVLSTATLTLADRVQILEERLNRLTSS